jgi:EPS-associated MarR family transcriptional regulator
MVWMEALRKSEETQILSVLDAIALDSHVSQRDLSRLTGLNLAKINYLLRKLAEKGFVKLRNISKNKNKFLYLYILTPHGIAEKSRLTVRFAARTWREYSQIIMRLRESLTRLVESGAARVVLVGANEVSDMVFEAGHGLKGFSVVGIVDPARAGEKCCGMRVATHARDIEFDRAIACVLAEADLGDTAKRAGIGEDKLWLV